VASPTCLDCTLGGGGHAEALLRSNPELRLFGVDRDPAAIERVAKRLAEHSSRSSFVHADFSDVTEAFQSQLAEEGLAGYHGILADLGVSSFQLDQAERGFSFAKKGPLDMRMNTEQSLSAATVVNEYAFPQLAGVFLRGECGALSYPLAKAIESSRPHLDTLGLADVCSRVAEKHRRGAPKKRSHAATLPFQAIRIEVNGELRSLEKFLAQIPECLLPGGRLAVISFHSLEDRFVARTMRSWSREPQELRHLPEPTESQTLGRLLTKKALTPSNLELEQNPRSRSARMRVFERCR
jgi:16S rRNA (cytosine1402-N4)-methyltransferase